MAKRRTPTQRSQDDLIRAELDRLDREIWRKSRERKIPIGPGRPGQKFTHGDTEITTTLHDMYVTRKGTKGLGTGASKAGQSVLRFIRREGGEHCGSGKLPAGSAALVRRGVLVKSSAGYRGEWCLRLARKMKRRKKGRH